VVATALVLAVAPVHPAAAQPPAQAEAGRTEALRVFLDCNSCDENYMRTEVTFVNYVRDRVGADVHVLVTTQQTGGGGVEYTFKFIGLDRFADVDQSLTFSAPQTATDDERRRGYTSIFKLGLVRYVAETPLASRLTLTFKEPPGQAAAGSVRDPWNFWVFRIGASGNLEGQELSNERSVDVEFSANRTTERWKINLNGETDYNREQFELEDGEIFTAISREADSEALAVKSLTEHWAVGGVFAVGMSTFQNYDLRARLAPGIEYNFFPYRESTRRIFTLLYTVGVQQADYTEETIFGRFSESLFDQQLEASLALRQPWGTASGSVELLHYLNRDSKYRLEGFGEVDVRLFKGFSLALFARGSRRRDQLSLRRGSATTEEILVRQRELSTGYEYEFGFGVSYSFGSVFNNVVNPRFRNVDGF
jgi:hypothetical protein